MEGSDLAERAFILPIPTPKASERPGEEGNSGMMLKAAVPVLDGTGRLLGVLYGGMLLNRNYQIVDKVRDLLYGEGRYNGKEMGTATIFLGGLRISTNVRNEHGDRAIGTRVSDEVYEAVIRKGQLWEDRAFVVNDWYITAYEPIRDISGKIVGILYVGMLEAPYIDFAEQGGLQLLRHRCPGRFLRSPALFLHHHRNHSAAAGDGLGHAENRRRGLIPGTPHFLQR